MNGLNTREIRKSLTALAAENKGLINRDDLAARLGIADTQKRSFFLNTLNRLLRNGEIQPDEASGLYRYVAESAPTYSYAENWARVYRAVRVAKGVFDKPQIKRVSGVSDTSVCMALKSLVEAGFIVETGKKGLKVFYQGTRLLNNTPGVPPAPKRERVPLQKAREALAELNRLFLVMDVTRSGAQKLIQEQLSIIQKEFEKRGPNDN